MRLLLAGGGLAYSILALVQSNLLDPLADIRSWARRVREGRYADPIPRPAYEAFAELADDLVGIAVGQRPRPDADSSAGHDADNQVQDGSLQTLYEVVSSINTAHGLDDLLTRFLFTLKRITQAHAAIIWVSHKPGHVELAASSGIDETLLLPERQDIRRCLYERALTEGRIWVNETLETCEKIAGRPFFGDSPIGLMSFPMRYRGRIIGVINLFLDRDSIGDVDHLKPLLTSVGHHLGSSQLAQEPEAKRVAAPAQSQSQAGWRCTLTHLSPPREKPVAQPDGSALDACQTRGGRAGWRAVCG